MLIYLLTTRKACLVKRSLKSSTLLSGKNSTFKWLRVLHFWFFLFLNIKISKATIFLKMLCARIGMTFEMALRVLLLLTCW